MFIQLNPTIPVYVPKFDMEGYAFALESNSLEHYLMFHIIMDNGEIWSLPQVQVRGCINYSAMRNKINKSEKSEFIDKLKSNG